MQPVKIGPAVSVARHELAVDDEGAHSSQAFQGVDHPRPLE
jgi:hypothetical protein